MKFLNKNQRETIGYQFIVDHLELFTPYSKEKITNLKPYDLANIIALKEEFSNIESFINFRTRMIDKVQEMERILPQIKNIKNSINRIENLHTLDDVEFFEIKNFSLKVQQLRDLLSTVNINISKIQLYSLTSIVNLLDPENKNLPTFHIYSEYSENLKRIREMKQNVEKEILNEKNKHIKPNLVKERSEIVVLEEKEELKIRKDLTVKISNDIDLIKKNIEILAYLDLLNAKSKIALEYNGIKPEITMNLELDLQEFFNPYIEQILSESGKKFMPITVKLQNGVTVITGANMGGKSVTLKTIALNILLCIMGFYVYAKKAKIPIVQYIHYLSGDMQSVKRGLSSFGAEILSFKNSLTYLKNGEGVFLIDEFAKGTNPHEAYILNKAILTYLKRFKCMILAVTHYDGIIEEDMNHFQVIGLRNVNFEDLKKEIKLNKKSGISVIQDYMDYRLIHVSSDEEIPKDALNISILLGLDQEIINLAEKYYEKDVKNGKEKKSKRE